MDPATKYGILLPVTIFASAILIVGGTRGWKWLIDPPEDLFSVYSQSLLKKLFGVSFVRRFTIAVGYGFLLLSLIVLLA